MNIVVCVKQVVDPDAPSGCFQIDQATQKLTVKDASLVIDPYGEYAVEAALKMKEANGAKVTVLTMGTGLVANVVKKPLAMGADELVLLEDDSFSEMSAYETALVLSSAIRKLGQVDLILAGREASDTGAGQTGPGIAELLGMPCVTIAKQIEVDGAEVRVHRVLSDGYEAVAVPLPAVVTVSNEVGEPRYPTMKRIMAAKRMQPTNFTPSDLEYDSSGAKKTKIIRTIKPTQEANCEFIMGETSEAQVNTLVNKLQEAKIV